MLYPRQEVHVDADGDVWIVTDFGPGRDVEYRLIGHYTRCELRVPDHLECEFVRKVREFEGDAAAGRDYEREGERLWNRR